MVKFYLFIASLGFQALVSTPGYAQDAPNNVDFVGGYFEDGVYRCYREPCFKVHKHAYPAANNIPFDEEMWPYWLDIDSNCQKENMQLLEKESLTPVKFERDDPCQPITAGSWNDAYSGELLSDAASVETDHLISMREAYEYGGLAWPIVKRAEFANIPANQVVVSVAQKTVRSGAPASQWMPPDKNYWCEYVVKRDRIARMFRLKFPESEKAFNREIKNLYCKF